MVMGVGGRGVAGTVSRAPTDRAGGGGAGRDGGEGASWMIRVTASLI